MDLPLQSAQLKQPPDLRESKNKKLERGSASDAISENNAASEEASGVVLEQSPPAKPQEVPEAAISSTAQKSTVAAMGRATAGGNFTAALQSSAERPPEVAIQSPDPRILWRVAGGSFVEISEDSGATWRGQMVNPSAYFMAGSAPRAKVCWLVGRGGAIYRTTDGAKWKAVKPPAELDFVGVAATDQRSATITAATGARFSTTDGGKNWKELK
jgi:photosystem II stability/assembly factor-like uncharacterized protein